MVKIWTLPSVFFQLQGHRRETSSQLCLVFLFGDLSFCYGFKVSVTCFNATRESFLLHQVVKRLWALWLDGLCEVWMFSIWEALLWVSSLVHRLIANHDLMRRRRLTNQIWMHWNVWIGCWGALGPDRQNLQEMSLFQSSSDLNPLCWAYKGAWLEELLLYLESINQSAHDLKLFFLVWADFR